MIHPRGFVTSQDELASGRPGNRLPHLACCARVCETGWGRRFRLPGQFFIPSSTSGSGSGWVSSAGPPGSQFFTPSDTWTLRTLLVAEGDHRIDLEGTTGGEIT